MHRRPILCRGGNYFSHFSINWCRLDAQNVIERRFFVKAVWLPEIGEIERRIRAMIGVFPAWSMPEEEEQRRILLSPSPKWTIDSPTIQTKANPLERCHFELSGTPFLNLLYDAMEDFNNGRPVADGIVVDEVEMTIYDDWECVGRLSYGEGDKGIYKPLVSVKGETKKQRLNWDVNLLHRNDLCADVLSTLTKEIPGRAGDEE